MRRPVLLLTLCAALMAPLAPAMADINYVVAERMKAGLWNGKRVMSDIAAQLSFGPRAMDTPGHEKTIEYIEGELAKTKAETVKAQQWVDTGEAGHSMFNWNHHKDSPRHTYANLIARFYPDNPHRIIIGTHYDSIIKAYKDRDNPEAPMPGANNSASGVALLLELARVLGSLPPPAVGVDLVFFDGEEGPRSLGAGDPEWYAIGSPYFADHIAEFYPTQNPEKAILFDMVCYKNIELDPEPISLRSAPNEVKKFWEIGATIAPNIFKQEPYAYPIDDDHDAFAKLGIPSFLVIGFKYEPYFNTTKDTLDKCSPATLEAVGQTLIKYIYVI